jgi:cellulose synthase/poly-beta-1,6-N-acetylglucosamine synthase-like glycosyltransferase
MISFVIPCYNEESHIKDCIRSIRKHVWYVPYEIIVVDNNCTDRTAEIAELELAKVIKEPRKGVVFARQAGYQVATGNLIANIDADSKITNGWVWEALSCLSNDNVVAVSGPLEYDGASFKLRMLTKFYYLLAKLSNDYIGVFLQGGNAMIKKKALDKVEGYDLSIAFYGEDTMTAKRIQHLGKIVFNMYMVTTTSPRRLKEQGVIKTTWLYLTNYFSVTFKNKSTTNDYKDFR